MEISGIRIGNTHTGQMVSGYCPICGLIHPAIRSTEACQQFRSAATPEEESSAWRALKTAVDLRDRRI